MPGRALTYKFLNTFIDDLFAFTIKMPWLYRVATFRDDIIFFVWVYQSYKYKVDYTRVNEFGQGGEDTDDAPKAVEAKQTSKTTAPAVASSATASSGSAVDESNSTRKRK
jgi:hypothetical protein